MKAFASMVLVLNLAAAAWADEGVPTALALAPRPQEPGAAPGKEKGSQDLAERVSKLEKAQESSKQTWDVSKMLSFSTADGNFTAKVGGRMYLTYRHIFDRDDAGGGAADTFAMDTARLQLDGTFFKDFTYRLEGEAQSQSDAGRIRMKEVYLGWHAVPELLTLQAGQMKTPWSQEETCTSRFIDFGERSYANRLAPAQDVGVLLKGTFADRVLECSLGVFNGAISRDSGRNSTDPNDEKDLVGRLFITPLRNSGEPLVEQLRVGFDFTTGDRDDLDFTAAATGNGISTGDLGGTVLNPFLAAAPNADGLQSRYLVNFSWIYGPASLRAEYAIVDTSLVDTALEGRFRMKAAYVQATCILTGESKPLENRIKPHGNLSPANGSWGAVELAARFALLDTSDGEDAGVVGPGVNAKTRELTVGVNWWWTPNVALRLNWEHFMLDEELAIRGGNDPLADTQDVFTVRWQIDF